MKKLKEEDYISLCEGVTYLWNDNKAVPLKPECIQGFIDFGAPVFKFENGQVIPLN